VEIGDTIKHYRKQKKLTQAQLAELANTGNRHVSQVERGNQLPSASMLQGIAAALGVPAWVLLYGRISAPILEMLALLSDCTENEQAELCSNLAAMKNSMRRFR